MLPLQTGNVPLSHEGSRTAWVLSVQVHLGNELSAHLKSPVFLKIFLFLNHKSLKHNIMT